VKEKNPIPGQDEESYIKDEQTRYDPKEQQDGIDTAIRCLLLSQACRFQLQTQFILQTELHFKKQGRFLSGIQNQMQQGQTGLQP
jgi:hypothetical protein